MTDLNPEVPEDEPFMCGTLEELREEGFFDAVVAIRSLHHVHDLPRALDNLRDALRGRGRLVLLGFAAEHYDDARRWATEHGIEPDWKLEHDPAHGASGRAGGAFPARRFGRAL